MTLAAFQSVWCSQKRFGFCHIAIKERGGPTGAVDTCPVL